MRVSLTFFRTNMHNTQPGYIPSEQLDRGDEFDSNINQLLSVVELNQSQPSSILFNPAYMISNTQIRNGIVTQYSPREHQCQAEQPQQGEQR